MDLAALEGREIRTEAASNETIPTDLEAASSHKMRATVWAYASLASDTRDAKIKFCQKMKYLIE